MNYRIIVITGNERSVIAEVVSEEWAKSFADDVKSWLQENGGWGGSYSKVIIEEI